MPQYCRAACLQMNALADIAANLALLEPQLAEAVRQGAQLIALPENVTFTGGDDALKCLHAKTENEHPALPFFAAQARRHGVWLMCGSLTIKRADGLHNNRSYLFAPDGNIAAHYDKIHLFDASLSGGETYRESDLVAPGSQAILTTTPFGKLGLTICYDVRFAQLYRVLAQAGAAIITVPAAFTVPTGQAHWHSLLRARAIETGCFILAPAQCGTHEGGRRTFGHSLIVDPWGSVLAEAGDEPTIIYADLNLEDVARVRHMLPSLQHDRTFAVTK